MRTIKTTTGAEIPLDGDLLAIMETIYREVKAKRELERSFRINACWVKPNYSFMVTHICFIRSTLILPLCAGRVNRQPINVH